MASEATPVRPAIKLTPKTHTTRRGMATASLCLGLWGFAIFFIYPFGAILGAIAATLGIISVLLGIRAGNEGQHLAWAGIALGSFAVGAALTIFRFYQFAFEGTLPWFVKS